MTTNTGIYHWKLGDVALARICKKVYAKVQVVKNEKGLFHDEKGISADESGLIITRQLCYYVEIIRTKHRLWLPYTCMHLAARSRPFYGPAIKEAITKPIIKSAPRKRKIIEDHILPLNVKPLKHKVPDLNVSYEIRQMPLRQSKYENAFKEFVRLGKEQLFDYFYEIFCLEDNGDIIDYLQNVDASTEDKFEVVIKNVVTEKEIDNYLHQCWRYNYVHKQVDTKDNSEYSKSSSSNKQPITVHISWCLVCGEADKLRECTNCPSSFHLACRREWLVSIIHRKKPPKKAPRVTLVEKILSSTRTICSVHKEKETLDLCPSCMWGPKVGYDDVVWHKLGSCPWWPARVLTPGTLPSCLLSRSHSPHQWPLKYYGKHCEETCMSEETLQVFKRHVKSVNPHLASVVDYGLIPLVLKRPVLRSTLNHAWGDSSRMCLFLPKHTRALEAKDDTLKQAVLDASDDYISVYLT